MIHFDEAIARMMCQKYFLFPNANENPFLERKLKNLEMSDKKKNDKIEIKGSESESF